MFVKSFKNNYSLQLLLIVAVPLLLWFAAFIFPIQMPTSHFDMPLYKVFFDIFSSLPFLAVLLAFICIYLQALALNHIFASKSLISKTTFLPAFIYLLLMSCSYKQMTLTPIVIANFFTITALSLLFSAYESKKSLDNIYNSTLFISLAALTYAPYGIFLLLVWCCLLNYSLYSWRYWVISLLGYITPLLFVAIYFFLNDVLVAKCVYYAQNISLGLWPVTKSLYVSKLIFYICMSLLFIWALFVTIQNRSNNNIAFRKRTTTTIIYFIIASICAIMCLYSTEAICILAPACALIGSNFFFAHRKLLYSNIVFSLLLILIVGRVITTIIQ